MLEDEVPEQTVRTGFRALDAVLGGLFWGESVVWELDGAPVEPFYRAIGHLRTVFPTRILVSLGGTDRLGIPGLDVIDSRHAEPADLLRELHRRCRRRGRRLLLFDSLDRMAQAWGVVGTREFFVRCCPLVLESGAIAYWSMTSRSAPTAVREAVEAVTQCVLHVDERSVRVAKAEGRDDGVRGSVLHWHDADGRMVLEPAETVDRLPASLQAVRRERHLSQHDLGDLAGVTGSAISQAERAERGLSLATLLRLSTALGVTVDDLLRGEESDAYRVGRRVEDPQQPGPGHAVTLLADAGRNLRIELVRLGARESGTPPSAEPGHAILACASGLVQVQIDGKMPTLRQGEVLVAGSEQVERLRNLRETEAVLFWIVLAPQASPSSPRTVSPARSR